MNALEEIKNKLNHGLTKIEQCIVEVYEINGLEWMAEEAAAELAQLRDDHAKLWKDNINLTETVAAKEARIAELEQWMKKAKELADMIKSQKEK